MLTEVCNYLKNWFNETQPKFYSRFKIQDGVLMSYNDEDMHIQDGQYYRIIGSVFNDGVHKHPADDLVDEVFGGAVWLMAVPKDVVSLAEDIKNWQTKYGSVDSENMSPYQSESFGGYSYSKSSGSDSSFYGSSPSWQSVFASRLWRYKKI